ncbi:MAG: carboxypeptidase regulatory-like domain-containing protein [Alistipes sp.]|nr:carboxypeptidase regulatory-like domain-containing protein [Alistipes sp.]
MRKIFATLIALATIGTAAAQGLAAVSGLPVPKKSADAIVGALVTFTSEWDKDLKYQRAVDKEGFRVVLPQGGYLLTIEAQGYETYKMEIEVDQPNIDLDLITMLTNEQAAARDEKRKKRANRF